MSLLVLGQTLIHARAWLLHAGGCAPPDLAAALASMSSSLPATPLQSPGTVLTLQQRRLQQILWAVMAAFGTAALMSFSKGGYTSVALELVALALLGLAYRWNQRGELARASQWMLATLIAGIFGLMAAGEGLYDEGTLAFPAILIFAGMFGSRRMLWVLMAWLQGALVLLFVLHQTGVIRAASAPVDLQRLVMMVAILAAIGFFVWLLTGDLHSTLAQLASEKEALAESHQRIDVLAHRDTLTQLPNRTLAKDRLEQLLLQARRDQRMVAALYLDLDNFKTVNDGLGHAAGDSLLRQVAQRLRQRVRQEDTLGRLGGDEFILVLEHLRHPQQAAHVATAILETLGEPFTLDGGQQVYVRASIGIAMFPDDGHDAAELVRNADAAMYESKRRGRNNFSFFTSNFTTNANSRLQLETRLRRAVELGEFVLHYQPMVRISDHQVVAVEALVRLRSPEGTDPPVSSIGPNEFIPVMEDTGMIVALGDWVLAEACRQAKAWLDAGLSFGRVAVNVSPSEISRGAVLERLTRILKDTGLPPACLELEITESGLMESGTAAETFLQAVHALGVHLTIDDFGTGYSSLAYLKRFPVQQLKIDRSFVQDLPGHDSDNQLVSTMIAMAHGLRLQVVAEGVEMPDQEAFLASLGCDMAQGYLHGRPMPAEQITPLLKPR